MEKIKKIIQFLYIFVSISTSIFADIDQQFQRTFFNFKDNQMHSYLVHELDCCSQVSQEVMQKNLKIDHIGAVLLCVCVNVSATLERKRDQFFTQNNPTDSQFYWPQNSQSDVPMYETSFQETSLVINGLQHKDIFKPSGSCDHVVESCSGSNVPLIVLTNPAGIITVVSLVATVLVIDRLSQMGLIHSRWSLAGFKESIFGMKIYEGDQYYKNWSNPKNLERKFPDFVRYQGVLSHRDVYEQEMSLCLIHASNLLACQASLKKMDWPHPACDKLLNFTLTADPIYISENEEYQLDVRLTRELKNCRDSAIASMKQRITKMYDIFESLGNELIYQLKKTVQDLKKFKIDSKLLMLVGTVAFDRFKDKQDDHIEPIEESWFAQDYLADMSKKNIVELFSQGSQYIQLLEDFEQILDLNDQFFVQHLSKKHHFLLDGYTDISKISVESIVDFIKEKIAIKKECAKACLQEIIVYCKKKGKSKILPNMTRSILKSSAHRLHDRNKKIEQRLLSHEQMTIDMKDIFSFFEENRFLCQLEHSNLIEDFITACLVNKS